MVYPYTSHSACLVCRGTSVLAGRQRAHDEMYLSTVWSCLEQRKSPYQVTVQVTYISNKLSFKMLAAKALCCAPVSEDTQFNSSCVVPISKAPTTCIRNCGMQALHSMTHEVIVLDVTL